MVRGAKKQMIVLKTGDSRYFDEAYFVLRREWKTGGSMRGDLLSEANRILEECEPECERPKRRRLGRAIALFLCGILCGGGAVLLISLII